MNPVIFMGYEKLFVSRHALLKALLYSFQTARTGKHEAMKYRQETLAGTKGMLQTLHNSISVL